VRELIEARAPQVRCVRSRREFYETLQHPCTAIFVDAVHLPETGAIGTTIPIIAIIGEGPTVAARWLDDYPWVQHVISESCLTEQRAGFELSVLLKSLQPNVRPSLVGYLGMSAHGRMARLVDAGRRGTRLDRMAQFFEAEGLGQRTIASLRDIAEELLTNAFYNAPVAAGFLPRPVSRSEELMISPGRACEISYGTTPDGLAFVRVKDLFGSLTRWRLVEVLKRCARTNMEVTLDSSMGGAGLGLWRIFSHASFLALTVVPTQYTEFLVGVARRPRPASQAPRTSKPYSIHLYFSELVGRLPSSAETRDPSDDVEFEASATFQLI
jgi:hypothetical protein